MEAICSSETSVDFQRTNGVISQEIVLFKKLILWQAEWLSTQVRPRNMRLVNNTSQFFSKTPNIKYDDDDDDDDSYFVWVWSVVPDFKETDKLQDI
jgi:hypothetical protein